MIVSASYRTDIPAFYGDWFMGRLTAGMCRVINPYGGPAYTVSLARESVDGFVFWTRNPDPFMDHFETLRGRGYPFVVQFTINGYPQEIDRSVPSVESQIDMFLRLAETHGPHVLVWRYDPIVLSSLTPPAFHGDNFAMICERLSGSTDEAVISFMNPYRKSRRNLDAAAGRFGFSWWQETPDEAKTLVSGLVATAASNAMQLSICSQPQYLAQEARAARCVDADRLSRVAGVPIAARKKGNRTGCECQESRDIGAYDTCPHGCVYCYAVNDRQRAASHLKRHDVGAQELGAR